MRAALRQRGPLVLDGSQRLNAAEPALAAGGINALVCVPVASSKGRGALLCAAWDEGAGFRPEHAARPIAMAQAVAMLLAVQDTADGHGLGVDRAVVAG